ncbi:MAG TPA: FHA domain-containing protein [Rhodocyclaceae bacterium]|nr:FHA domain-containing protein [Rhodocyclaceae bacterium]
METIMEATNFEPIQLVVETLDHRGHVLHRDRITLDESKPSFSIGRSIRADVMLDDPHVAALHAQVTVTHNEVHVTDLGSQNGITVAGKHLHAASNVLLPDNCLAIGRSRLRIRLPHETLAPELADRAELGRITPQMAPRIAAVGLIVCMAFIIYSVWLEAPRDPLLPMVVGLLSSLLVVGVWKAVWSLITRVMQNEWRWLSHAAVFLGVMAGLYALDAVLEVVWFSLGLPLAEWRELILMVLAGMLVMYGHLAITASIRPATAALVAVLLPLLVAVPATWMSERSHSKDVNFIAEPDPMFPAALRLRASSSLDDFFAQAAKLKDASDQRRKALQDDDGEDGASEEE